jgi:transposase-like protein
MFFALDAISDLPSENCFRRCTRSPGPAALEGDRACTPLSDTDEGECPCLSIATPSVALSPMHGQPHSVRRDERSGHGTSCLNCVIRTHRFNCNELIDAEIRRRLKWIEMYNERGDAGQVCRRCGISRPTLRKWLRRYEQQGSERLRSHSRRPHRSPNRKVDEEDRKAILQLRSTGNGARRIQSEMRLHEGREFLLATITSYWLPQAVTRW